MKIIEIKDRNDQLLNILVNVWEDSVKATHTFLNEQEIEHIKEYVPMALKSVEHLMVVDNDEAIAIGIVVSTLYLALYTPHNSALVFDETSKIPVTIFPYIGLSRRLLML